MLSMTDTPVIKLPELTIGTIRGWSGDTLGRKQYAQALTCALACHGSPMTFAVNGVWGSGKTYLLKNWQADLENVGYKVIYIDAWKDDFVEDPLTVIIGQFALSLSPKELFAFSLPSRRGFFGTLWRVWMRFWWWVTARLLKLTTLSLVDMYEIGSDINDIIKTGWQSKSWGVVEDYRKAVAAQTDFRSRFEKLALKYSKDTKCPLVFIIDEVDRCRPTFSVALLERIKHLLNVKNTVFALGVDTEALGTTIKTVYGEIDVENYLRRFFDIKFNLPNPNRVQYIDLLWKRYLLDERIRSYVHDPEDAKTRDENVFKELLSDYADCAQLSLREIEEAMRLFMMLFLSGGHDIVLPPYQSVVMIILKLRNRKMYEEFTSLTYDIEAVVEEIVRIPFDDPLHKNQIVRAVGTVFALAQSTSYNEEMGRLSNIAHSPKVEGWQREYGRLYTESGSEELLRSIEHFARNLRHQLYPDEDRFCYDESRLRDMETCVERLECHKAFHYPV